MVDCARARVFAHREMGRGQRGATDRTTNVREVGGFAKSVIRPGGSKARIPMRSLASIRSLAIPRIVPDVGRIGGLAPSMIGMIEQQLIIFEHPHQQGAAGESTDVRPKGDAATGRAHR